MASPTMWSGKQGAVLMSFREYPKPCGSQIFNEQEPIVFHDPTIDNTAMTFKEWTVVLTMTMLERNMPTSRGEGFYPTLPSSEITLGGLVPRGVDPGFYLGCPMWWTLRLDKDTDELDEAGDVVATFTETLGFKMPVIISKIDYANALNSSYGMTVSAKTDWSFDVTSSDPIYDGWVDIDNDSIIPGRPLLSEYPWTVKGTTS